MAVDPARHLSVFAPSRFKGKRVDVIGCGATGSRVALALADLGVENLHLWDPDTVAEKNLANQAYGLGDVGQPKVSALARLIREKTGIAVIEHQQLAEAGCAFGNVVFVLTDTMASRSELWFDTLKYKLGVELVVETRMGPDTGMVYAVVPNRPHHIKAYEATLYADEESSESVCGGKTSVGPTAEIIAGLAIWQMIRWFSVEQGGDDELDNELIVSIRPAMILSRKF